MMARSYIDKECSCSFPSLQSHPIIIPGPPRDYKGFISAIRLPLSHTPGYPPSLRLTLSWDSQHRPVPSRLWPYLYVAGAHLTLLISLFLAFYIITYTYSQSLVGISLRITYHHHHVFVLSVSPSLAEITLSTIYHHQPVAHYHRLYYQVISPTSSHNVRLCQELLHLLGVYRSGRTLLQNLSRRQQGKCVPTGPPREVHRPARHMSTV